MALSPVGFLRRDYRTGEIAAYQLVGSHTSAVRVGERPSTKPGCAGCGVHRQPKEPL